MEMSSKEAAFIREHWPVEGRAERIARAEQAWRLDPETLKWIAEDPDLEYL